MKAFHPSTAEIKTVLEQTGLFHTLPQEALELFIGKAKIHHFPKGKSLFSQGDKAELFYIIIQGWIKLFHETLDGDQAVMDVLTASYILGESAMFNENYPYSAEVVEDAILLALPHTFMGHYIQENGKFTINMLNTLSRFRQQQNKEIEHRMLQSAPQRLGCFLLRLCKENETSPILLHLPYDKALISSRLGMQPETFSRAFAKLEEETGVKLKGASVKIPDVKRLSEFACNACSSSYPCDD